jgi:hypothetical protein
MEPLVEVHSDEALYVTLAAEGSKVIGVNNQSLQTFQVDIAMSEQVAHKLKEQNLSLFHVYDNEKTKTDTMPDYIICVLSGMSTSVLSGWFGYVLDCRITHECSQLGLPQYQAVFKSGQYNHNNNRSCKQVAHTWPALNLSRFMGLPIHMMPWQHVRPVPI